MSWRALLAFWLAVLTLPAIGTESVSKSGAPLRIVASFYPVYIATINVVGQTPGVEVANLTKPMTGCLHDYQMTPADMTTLSKADIFVINGAGMEAFMDKALQHAPKIKTVDASEGIDVIKDAGGTANPHVWVSISLAIKQVENVARGLAGLDPAHAAMYAANASNYVVRLESLRAKMQAGLKDARTRDIITFHEAFPYFARELHLNIVAVIEREPGSEPGAKELAATIGIVRRHGVKALFAEPQYSAKSAEVIARETGARVYTLDPAVTGPMEPDAYVKIMEKNLATLQEALR